jgi:hypothetical protein
MDIFRQAMVTGGSSFLGRNSQCHQGKWVCPSYEKCDLPSGNLLHNYGKSPLFMRKFAISMVIFQGNMKRTVSLHWMRESHLQI